MTWSADRRLDYIDWRLATHGEVSRPDIARTFNVSLSIATQDLAAYDREYPGKIEYDTVRRRYLPAKGSHRPARAIARAIIAGDPNPLAWS